MRIPYKMSSLKLLPILFFGFINPAHSQYMSNQQLGGIFQDISNELKITGNAALSNDIDTACSAGKTAVKLFYTINRDKDVPPEFLQMYKTSQAQILNIARQIKEIC